VTVGRRKRSPMVANMRRMNGEYRRRETIREYDHYKKSRRGESWFWLWVETPHWSVSTS
jgi:hypothetical protein